MSSLVRKLEHYRREDYHGLDIRADMAEMPDSFAEWGDRRTDDYDPDPLNKAAYLSMYPLAWEHEESRRYLQGRGIGEATSRTLHLQFDDEEHRILFPVFDHAGELYGFTGRSTLSPTRVAAINEARAAQRQRPYPKVRDYAGLPKEKLLLGEHLISESGPLWIVEGLFALAHMLEIGLGDYANPVATMGSAMSNYQRDLIIGYCRPAWLVYDNDAAGDIGVLGKPQPDGRRKGGAYMALSPHVPTLIPYWPEGIDDPDKLTLPHCLDMMDGETYQPGDIFVDNESVSNKVR